MISAPAPLRETLKLSWDALSAMSDAFVKNGVHDGNKGRALRLYSAAVKSIEQSLSALPTDAVQPVGGVDREAVASIVDGGLIKWFEEIQIEFPTGNLLPETYRSTAEASDALAKCRTDAILALYATAPTAGSGWVMVPREPTEAMIEAGLQAPHQAYEPAEPGDVWSAMIAAAPTDAGSHDFSKNSAVTGKFFKHWACEGDEYAESSTAAPTVGDE